MPKKDTINGVDGNVSIIYKVTNFYRSFSQISE